MHVDVKLPKPDALGPDRLTALAEVGTTAEQRGFSGLWSAESTGDPFLPLVAVAGATERLELGTAITVAFARNPMQLAYTAHDLHLLSGGRLLLGLGSQVRPHIERRYGMLWSRPAARMREFVEVLRAIWEAWNTGSKLDFRGDFYSHTLMTPFFSPEPSPSGPPKVYLAAVGDKMTEVAGAVCDGLLPHPFTTERYLREYTLPTLQRGLDQRGRTLDTFSVSLSGLVVTGRTEEEMAAARRAAIEQIAFYGSTPAYYSVLALHGWEDLGHELTALSKSDTEDRWSRMGSIIDDDVLNTFAVVAEPDRLGPAIEARFGDLVDRFSFYAPYDHDHELCSAAMEHLRRAGTAERAAAGVREH
ncbi:TIGR03617 family F420-dependent LLM class oxidoreductase [Nocardia sp. NBC_00881]|uniref:TIGR03617 family F420-dependent LLM class oxidoreductase n=1 Tax=Nocardia sp. NBC_00881 TaxID=2975995 RepID=UPI0038682976|nr:TIGR03617 family F420-dependent LLM class oxidoreductase [Nocardia sp. NBC_00881]